MKLSINKNFNSIKKFIYVKGDKSIGKKRKTKQ